MIKRLLYTVATVIVIAICWLGNMQHKDVLNIYGWYGIFPSKIMQQFEKEYKVKIVFDFFDNNNVLETNLLSGTSGYDIVFPSFIPYGSRQVSINAFDKIDYKQIPNIKNIEGDITEQFKNNQGDLEYLLPIFWGTMGIVYNKDIAQTQVTYNDLFDPEFMTKIASYGISFPEEYIDILPQVAAFLNKSIKNPIEDCITVFSPIRKYIKKFNSSTVIYDLLSDEICLAICSSDHAWKAMNAAKHINKQIEYSLPQGMTTLWIDCIAIPKKAKHKDIAYKFINFILKPEIAAEIMNYSGILMNVPSARQYVDEDLKANHKIYPTQGIDKFIMGQPILNDQARQYDKAATKAWTQVKLNKLGEQND